MKRVLLMMVVVLSMVSVVSALPIDAVYIDEVGNFTQGTMKIWSGSHINGEEVYGGFYLLRKNGGAGAGDLIADGVIKGFCIDLFQNTASGYKWYNIVDVMSAPVPHGAMGAAKKDALSELLGRYYSTAETSGRLAEAMSAAVWEIIYETGDEWDVTSGWGFRASWVDSETANEWLASLDGTGPRAEIIAFSNGCYQDFMVPEPATVVLLGLGFGVFASRKGRVN